MDAQYPDIEGFAGFDFEESSNSMPYRLLIPQKLEPEHRYPLVLFLHCLVGIGDNNKAHLYLPVKFSKNYSVFEKGVFVLAPQCPLDDRWVEGIGIRKAHEIYFHKEPTLALAMAMKILKQVLKTYPVDTSRVYAGGASMGAFGVCELLIRHPDLFAAAFSICGGAPVEYANLIAKTPLWAFHGLADPIVPAHMSSDIVKSVQRCGGKARFSGYPDVLHDSWTPALSETELLDWLLGHQSSF